MREFAIPYSEGFRRGLRRFPVSQRDEEWLTECHNLMPSEKGLIDHETLMEIGFTRPFFNYFAINDQDGTTWYWYIDVALNLDPFNTNPPSVVPFDATDLALSPIPSWLEIDDPASITRYIYPEVTGDINVAAAAPTNGVGLVGSLTLKAVAGRNYSLTLDAALNIVLS